MGVCASCLGHNRHPSHRRHETDALLEDGQVTGYGTLDDEEEVTPQDEEDLQREREVLNQITARVTEDMLDVLHADNVELGHRLTSNLSSRSLASKLYVPDDAPQDSDVQIEEVERAWLKDLPSGESDNEALVKGVYGGNLVIDLSRLRDV